MVEVKMEGIYLLNNEFIVEQSKQEATFLSEGRDVLKERQKASGETMASQILQAHNISKMPGQLQIRFDQLVSHDITYVGIIQTARAAGMESFGLPYTLTNCHNSLCAVGGTINEDDHMFGLSCAKKYGGAYVPPHQAVIHQYAREELATAGGMILGSDSHTRYGALGTMAMGEGGPELVKQLLGKTYDIKKPEVVLIYLTGQLHQGVGPQDVALALVGATFKEGVVKNKVLEFAGPGLKTLTAEERIGIDVMTTETTCLSSIWRTDETIHEYYKIHGREKDYREIHPGQVAYYDGMVHIDLSSIRPMIAMPFHPSYVYEIEAFNEAPEKILKEVEQRAKVSLGDCEYSLAEKLKGGAFYVDQGIIAGCAGGGFENICAAADILRGKTIGNGEFTLSVYPASMPIYMELMKNQVAVELVAAGAVMKTAFCGPCFGAGDTPANQSFSIRHTTRNFPNREGSKLQEGQISSVALMDARSIAATAANQGRLTPASELTGPYHSYPYHFDRQIYQKRVLDARGKADPSTPIHFGPNIKDWPSMAPLPEHLLLKVVSKIEDPVTTTDELIPSGETSSYRSNPLGLAQFTLSRKDPEYVKRATEVQKAQQLLEKEEDPLEVLPELTAVEEWLRKKYPRWKEEGYGLGSTIFAKQPGDGSAREQAASCQKVLGGWANIAHKYATKRYRSNLINWGMLPLEVEENETTLQVGSYIFLPYIRRAILGGEEQVSGYVVTDQGRGILFSLGELSSRDRDILLKGCLINAYREEKSE